MTLDKHDSMSEKINLYYSDKTHSKKNLVCCRTVILPAQQDPFLQMWFN